MTTNADNLMSGISLSADEISQDDERAIIEQIWSALRGKASRSDIRRELVAVTPKYANAPIQTFVPIFLYKEVRERLLESASDFIVTNEVGSDPKYPNREQS